MLSKLQKAAAVLAISVGTVAQAQAGGWPAACGKEDVKFKVKTDKSNPDITAPADGKAQVVLVEALSGYFMSAPTIRFGLDGSWVGADHGASWFAVAVTPGEHHLCASQQGSSAGEKANVKNMSVSVEAGKTYFYQLRITRTEIGDLDRQASGGVPGRPPMLDSKQKDTSDSIDLQKVSESDGNELVRKSAMSTSAAK